MANLFFNPNGRIARARFWQGMVVLTVLSVIVSAATWLVDPIFQYLSWALIFPYVCVYGKRFHDAGQTAWWVIAIFVSAFILRVILLLIMLFTLFPSLMTPEQKEIWQQILVLIEEGDSAEATKGFNVLFESMAGLVERSLIGIFVVSNVIMALIVGFLKTDPKENKHGPVPGSSAADTFQ